MTIVLLILAVFCFISAVNAAAHAIGGIVAMHPATTVICGIGAAFWGAMGYFCVRGMRS